jgi:hypothetical protein
LGKKLVYELEVLQGYQRALDPRSVYTLEGRRNQKKQGNLQTWEKKVCNIIDMMVVAHNNELVFQRLFGHCPT